MTSITGIVRTVARGLMEIFDSRPNGLILSVEILAQTIEKRTNKKITNTYILLSLEFLFSRNKLRLYLAANGHLAQSSHFNELDAFARIYEFVGYKGKTIKLRRDDDPEQAEQQEIEVPTINSEDSILIKPVHQQHQLQTEILTPEDLKRQADKLIEQAKRMEKEQASKTVLLTMQRNISRELVNHQKQLDALIDTSASLQKLCNELKTALSGIK